MEYHQSDRFLAAKTAAICREYFKHREITNLLIVKWGKPWKTKLGHIKALKGNPELGSVIEINTVFKDPRVPQYVIDVTILHELVHYFQGFGSNHVRRHRHPHRGGAVDNELVEFGWKELMKKQDEWVHQNWVKIWTEHNRQYKIGRSQTTF